MDPKDKERLEREIAEHLTRAANALARGVERVATRVEQRFDESVDRPRDPRTRALPRAEGTPWWAQIAQEVQHVAQESRRSREEERRRRREERRARRRAEELDRASTFNGAAFMVVALFLLVAAIVSGLQYWWLVFPAFGFAMSGGRQFGLAAEKRRLAAPAEAAPAKASKAVKGSSPAVKSPAAQPVDPRAERIDKACERLLAALNGAPESIRAFLGKPEKMVAQLRETAHQLSARERTLRELITPEETERLAAERAQLSNRVVNETDDIVRSRLSAALAALDQQLTQREAIAKNAARLEAEHLRLAYTLEGLHAQVVRMRAADQASTDVAGAAMQKSVEELRSELGALADALEQVNAASPVATDEDTSGERTRTR